MARRLKRAEHDRAPFVGCDGEGTTDPKTGKHSYSLFRMGKRELFNDGKRLTTGELLAFILDHPSKTDILVGFAFEYDVTCILIDLTKAQRAHLIATYQQKHAPGSERIKGGNRWTWVDTPQGRFGVNWLGRNHLKVCRPHPNPKVKNASDRTSIRTIFDTWGFFACSFLKAIKAWQVGARHWETIETNKQKRESFERITRSIRRYNKIECELLAEMMERFRATCFECGIKPKTWNGAGKIAAALHREFGTITAKELAKLAPIGVIRMAHAAYYGGRFEITRVGFLTDITERDINSAYPAAMLVMPCLVHGKWSMSSSAALAAAGPDAIFVCPVKFTHPREQFLCGLPFRSAKDGRLSWPRYGNGVYWSPEIRSAERLGATISLRAGWLYERRCDCKPFAGLEVRYAQRKALGDQKGEPIKRGINSLYGKLAQRIGEPPFANPIHAGLITALTRAKLNDAILEAGPRNVVMLATDAILTQGDRIAAPASKALGAWDKKSFPNLFVVQPGLYWPPKNDDPRSEAGTGGWKVKSRGISPATIGKFAPQFEAAWRDYAATPSPDFQTRMERIVDVLDAGRADLFAVAWHGERYPWVPITFPAFIGLRLAGHWNAPEKAGQWEKQDRKLSFDWRGKRDGEVIWDEARRACILDPKRGDPKAVSAHYLETGVLSTSEGWEVERLLFEAMPDAASMIELFPGEDEE